MAQIETWFSQDLQQTVKVHYIDGNVFSADNNGNIIGVNVFDDGEPATLGGTVSASIIRADGATVAATGTLSGNQVSVSLPQSAYAVPGVISIVLKLTSGTDITTLLAVVGNVYQSTTDTVVDPGTIIPSIDTLIAAIEAAVASIPADYSDLNSAIDYTELTLTPFIENEYINKDNGQFVQYNWWSRTDYIEIPNVDKLHTKSSISAEYNCFYNGNKAFISSFTIPQGNGEITIPNGAVYLAISAQAANISSIEVAYNQIDKLSFRIDQVENEIEQIEKTEKTIEVIPKIDSSYVETNGVITPYNGWSVSQQISVLTAEYIKAKFPLEGLSYNCFYDINGNFVANFRVETTETVIPVPRSAAYILISNHTERFSGIELSVVAFDNKKTRRSLATAKIKGISRLGIKTNAPEQSIPAYKEAVSQNFKYLLCDLQFTSDSVPVCVHDPSINRVARNSDGSEISATVTVASSTLEQLNTYDFGIAAGSQFAGLKVLQLTEFLKFCKMCGVYPYIEIKAGTKDQIASAVELVESYGLLNSTSFSAFNANANGSIRHEADWVIEANPQARIGLMTSGNGMSESGYLPHLLQLQTGKNSVFCFNWNTESVTDAELAFLIEHEIEYEVGTIDTVSGMVNYLSQTNKEITTGIESNLIEAASALKEYALTQS